MLVNAASFRRIMRGELSSVFGLTVKNDFSNVAEARTRESKLVVLVVPGCRKDCITQWLKRVYHTSRGFELGTFDSSILKRTVRNNCIFCNLLLTMNHDLRAVVVLVVLVLRLV